MTIYPFRHPRRVYCAGPLFNAAERQEMNHIADQLRRAGFEPFVPHADGMEFACVQPYLIARGVAPAAVGQRVHEAVFALDVYQVVAGCGALVLNLNGRVPDEGAVSEAAMAWMLGKPLVAFKEDARSAVAGRDNPLVVGLTRFRTVGQIEAIPPALETRLTELDLTTETPFECPAHLAETLRLGERFWQELTRFGSARPTPQVAELIWELFDGAPGASPALSC